MEMKRLAMMVSESISGKFYSFTEFVALLDNK